MNETLFKLVDVVQRSTEFVDKGWSYYSTVTLAVLAIAYGSEKVRLTDALRRVIALGYLIFSLGNCAAIVRAQESAIRWITLFNGELQKVTPPLPIEPISPFPVWQLVVLHLSITVVVVIAILMAHRVKMAAPRRRS
jgi:hypothetical protein